MSRFVSPKCMQISMKKVIFFVLFKEGKDYYKKGCFLGALEFLFFSFLFSSTQVALKMKFTCMLNNRTRMHLFRLFLTFWFFILCYLFWVYAWVDLVGGFWHSLLLFTIFTMTIELYVRNMAPNVKILNPSLAVAAPLLGAKSPFSLSHTHTHARLPARPHGNYGLLY